MVKTLGTAVLALGLVVAWLSPTAAQSTRVHLIQGIPDTSIDLEIDGKVVARDLGFRGTYDVSSLGGQRLPAVKIKRAGTGEVLLNAGDVTLPNAANVTVVLHLKLDGSTGLSSFENDVTKLRAGQSRLVVRHLAAAPPVDVVSAGKVVFENLANGQEVGADLPAGAVAASLVPSGTAGPAILGPADLTLEEGVALIVYGLGSIERNTMAVATESIPGLGGSPTEVNTGNSVVGGPTPTPVWVYLAPIGALAMLGSLALRSSRASRRLT